jgi:peptidoglycan biosynthesis protein MviN/MurJ (putative lipid II flippase)
MQAYKKTIFIFGIFSMVVNMILNTAHIFLRGTPSAIAYCLAYLIIISVGVAVLLWFLRKNTEWVSTVLGALGIVTLATLVATGIDFVLPQ